MDPVLLTATLAKILFVIIIIMTVAPVCIWADRRQSAMIQDRLGPIRAGVRVGGRNIALAGLLHPLADAIKLMWKEDFVPPQADRFLHAAAPLIALIPAFAAFAVIPFGDTLYLEYAGRQLPDSGQLVGTVIPLQVASINVGILFVFAVAGTGVVGAALAGYSSNNKYSLLGGLRAAGQMVSYEVTLALSLVGCFMVYDSLLLEEMVQWQINKGWLGEYLGWGIFVQPLAFVVFLGAAIAEQKRIPFDLPEAESELAAGFMVEYSTMKQGMFKMGEYVELVLTAALVTVLFLGGHHLPGLQPDGSFFGIDLGLTHGVVVAIGVLVFLLKMIVMIWLQIMIRWSLPRFRYDQLMKVCWLYMLPLSLLNVFVTGMLILGGLYG